MGSHPVPESKLFWRGVFRGRDRSTGQHCKVRTETKQRTKTTVTMGSISTWPSTTAWHPRMLPRSQCWACSCCCGSAAWFEGGMISLHVARRCPFLHAFLLAHLKDVTVQSLCVSRAVFLAQSALQLLGVTILFLDVSWLSVRLARAQSSDQGCMCGDMYSLHARRQRCGIRDTRGQA